MGSHTQHPLRSTLCLMQHVLLQVSLSFYRQQPIRADFSGGRSPTMPAFCSCAASIGAIISPTNRPRTSTILLTTTTRALTLWHCYGNASGDEDAKDAVRLRHQPSQRSFSSFRHRARSWPRHRRRNQTRFLITNCPGRARVVFASYNDRASVRTASRSSRTGSASTA
jgi:hypothetical protein